MKKVLCVIALSLSLASIAIADEPQKFCGAASQFTVPSDLLNVEGDLSLEHVVKTPARILCAGH